MQVTFLFGSGADTDADEKLKSGADFAKSLLTNKYSKQIKEILGENQSSFSLVHPNSRKVFIQTVYDYQYEAAKSGIEKKYIDYCIAYTQGTLQDDDSKKELSNKCKEWYNLLKRDTQNKNGVCKFFLDNAVFFDTLDEKFNSLKNISFDSNTQEIRLNANAKRVLNAYWTVFFDMLKSLGEDINKKGYCFDDILNFWQKKYSSVNENSYYAVVESSQLNANIVTTNYTELAEQTGCQDIVYLHGKLTWFEDATDLLVFDSKNENEKIKDAYSNNHTILPFILIPSGVKPVICSRQINEFARFIEKMKDTTFLVVVGYKFNLEDNHINSIIAEWLKSNPDRKMIYLNFNECVAFSSYAFFEKKVIYDCNYNKGEVVNLLSLNKQIINIRVEKEDSRDAFKEIVLRLKELTENKKAQC